MKTTLDQLAYNILSLATGGRPTNSEYISLRRVKDWIHKYRALYIRRDLDRNRRLREFEQTVPNLALEPSVHPHLGEIMRTVQNLPTLVRLKDAEALTFVGDYEGTLSLQVVDNHSVPWRGFSRHTPLQTVAFILADNKVYIKDPDPGMETVTVRGIFSNPEEVVDFLIDEGYMEEEEQWEYPLPADMVESITRTILAQEVQATLGSPLDLRHDTIPERGAVPTAPPEQE